MKIFCISFCLLLLALMSRAQLNENFSDLNFNQNPTWTGDTTVFIVNSSGQLQLNNSGNAGSSALTTSVNLNSLDSIEWLFYIKLSFAGSGSNNARVYLTSDNPDIKSALNGYYLLFGESGSNDAIELFRQTGTTSVSVCRGTAAAIAGSVNASVKVQRRAGGKWQLWVDYQGGTNYALDAQGIDNTFTNSSYFGFLCNYTSSNATKFYFDDILIRPILQDTIKPTLVSATAVNANTVDVLFSEPIKQTSANTISNYFINNGIGIPSSATRDNVNQALVRLVLTNPLTNNTTYTLAVNNIEDLTGNVISNNSSINFTYFMTSAPQMHDVVINEIYADNSSSQNFTQINGAGKFVELYNRSNKTFDLTGWRLSANTSNKILGSYILQPGAYVVLCPSVDTSFYKNYGPVLGFGTSLSIAQSGSTITLQTGTNQLIDQIKFTDSWYNDNVKKDGAYTLERINPDDTCLSQKENWSAANSPAVGGTPGYQNSIFSQNSDATPPTITGVTIIGAQLVQICFSESMDSALLNNKNHYFINNGITVTSIAGLNADLSCVTLNVNAPFDSNLTYQLLTINLADCRGNPLASSGTFTFGVLKSAVPGDVVINEIMADPTPEVLLPNAEFVELHNVSNKRILLNKWKLRVGTSNKNIDNTILGPGEFLILCGKADTSLFSPFGKIAATSSSLSLTNGGATLELLDSANKSIDKVTYSSNWYNDAVKKDGGWTLEKINPFDNCSAIGNWSASVDNSGGTPGKINSIFNGAPDVAGPQIISAKALNKFSFEITFNETLDSIQSQNVSLYQVRSASNGNYINVINANCIAPFYNRVRITLTDSLILGQLYFVEVTGISDCKGNITTNTLQTEVGRYRLPRAYEVVINEIMADPSPIVGLPAYEYIEIYNRSNETLSLNKVQIRSGSGKTTLTEFNIKPAQYLLIIPASAQQDFSNIPNKLVLPSLLSIPNEGSTLYLTDSLNRVIHAVAYNTDWYKNSQKSEGGWSLEQIDFNNPCEGENNWKASDNIKGGTPGAVNSVKAGNPDNIKPRLVRVNVKSANVIEAIFTESLDSATIFNPSIYTIDKGIGNPIQVKPNGPQFISADLTLNTSLDSTTGYTLTVSHTITDCIGNAIQPDYTTARFGIPRLPKAGDVLINEILPDPRDGGEEFVEIYNKSDKIIDLKYLAFLTFSSTSGALSTVYNLKPEGYLMFPGDYLVLTEKAKGVLDFYNVKNDLAVIESNMPSLSNSGGSVVLGDLNNKELDRIDYTDKMHYPLLNTTKGVSLERISLLKETNNPSNWHSAAENIGFGTPTAPNSQLIDGGLSGNFVLSSEIFSPDNDGYQDVLAINYTLEKSGLLANINIFDGSGRQVRSLVKNELLGIEGVYLWDGLNDNQQRTAIGPYIILIELTDIDGTISRVKKSVVVATRLN